MGVVEFEHEPWHEKRIKSALKRRGLEIDYANGWEVHGPHQGCNYQVYVGEAYDKMEDINIEVIIFPHAVYEIISDHEKEKIPTLQTLKKNKAYSYSKFGSKN